MEVWQLQEAKNKFSALVNLALTEGPQYVSRHGKKAVVVMSVEDYENKLKARPSFKDVLRNLPFEDLDLSREDTPDRDIDLGD